MQPVEGRLATVSGLVGHTASFSRSPCLLLRLFKMQSPSQLVGRSETGSGPDLASGHAVPTLAEILAGSRER